MSVVRQSKYIPGAYEYRTLDVYDALGSDALIPLTDVFKILINEDIIGCELEYIPESCLGSFITVARGQQP